MGWRDSRAHKGVKLCSLRFYLARQLKGAEDFQDFIKPWFWENIGPVNSKVTSWLLMGIFKADTYPCFLSRVCPFSWCLNNSVHWRVQLGWLSFLRKLDSISMYVHAPTGPQGPERPSCLSGAMDKDLLAWEAFYGWAEFLLSISEHTAEQSKTKIDVYIESPKGNFCLAWVLSYSTLTHNILLGLLCWKPILHSTCFLTLCPLANQ